MSDLRDEITATICDVNWERPSATTDAILAMVAEALMSEDVQGDVGAYYAAAHNGVEDYINRDGYRQHCIYEGMAFVDVALTSAGIVKGEEE